MKLKQLQYESKETFSISYQPEFILRWRDIVLKKGTTAIEIIQKERLIVKHLSGGIYCFSSEEGEFLYEKVMPDLKDRVFFLLQPIIVRNLSIDCAVKCSENQVIELKINVKRLNDEFDLCPVHVSNGNFDFVNSPRNSPHYILVNSISIYYGCDTVDDRNCWLIFTL